MSINKPSVAYYLLPARAWELGIGAVLAVGVVPQVRGAALREALPVVGVGMILFSLFWISSDTVFPGWVALVPCLGAAMVIHAGGESWIARCFLASRPMVLIGLLSYSLYLWHWPVLVALRTYLVEPHLDAATAITGIAATFVLAWLSWRFVEQPFRDRRALPAPRMLRLLAAGSIAAAGIAGVSIAAGGFPSRLSERGHILLSAATDTDHYRVCPHGAIDRACQLGGEADPLRILVIGDSHTPALHKAFEDFAFEAGINGALYWHSACPLLDGAWREGDGYRSACSSFRERVFRQVEALPELETVVLVGSWQGQLGTSRAGSNYPLLDSGSLERSPEEARRVLLRSMDRTLRRLEDRGLSVLILGSSPGAEFDVPRTLALAELNGASQSGSSDAAAVRPVQSEIDDLLRTAAQRHQRVAYVPLWDVFCPGEQCHLTVGDKPIYADGGHLSGSGATEFLGPVLRDRVQAGLNEVGNRW